MSCAFWSGCRSGIGHLQGPRGLASLSFGHKNKSQRGLRPNNLNKIGSSKEIGRSVRINNLLNFKMKQTYYEGFHPFGSATCTRLCLLSNEQIKTHQNKQPYLFQILESI